jgi:hypothetical protein
LNCTDYLWRMHLRIARPNYIGPSDFTGKLGFKY